MIFPLIAAQVDLSRHKGCYCIFEQLLTWLSHWEMCKSQQKPARSSRESTTGLASPRESSTGMSFPGNLSHILDPCSILNRSIYLAAKVFDPEMRLPPAHICSTSVWGLQPKLHPPG